MRETPQLLGSSQGYKFFAVEDDLLPSRLKYENGRKDGNKLGKRKATKRVVDAVADTQRHAIYWPKSYSLKKYIEPHLKNYTELQKST